MKKSTKDITKVSEKGQVLLFVVVTMTIALALGVGVSLETLSSITNIADTDTSQKSLAAAEGSVERFLSLSDTQLEEFINTEDIGEACAAIGLSDTEEADGCVVSFAATNQQGDVIDLEAFVELTEFRYTSPDAYRPFYEFSIPNNSVKEVNLEGYSGGNLLVCWADDVDIHYSLYNSDGESSKEFVYCHGGPCSTSDWGISTAADAVDGSTIRGGDIDGNCYSIDVSSVSDPLGIRFRPLGSSSLIRIFPANDDLPIQGYKITATGVLADSSEIIRKVVAYKSKPYISGIFDFVLFGNQGIN